MSIWDELSRPQKAGIFAAVLIGTLAVGYWMGVSRADSPPPAELPIERIEPPAQGQPQTGRITVYVSGAVHEPGLFDMPERSRVVDAIEAAGGLTTDADSASVNMAEVLEDGDHVSVKFLKGEKPPTSLAFPININTADVHELEQLPGIGPSIAEEIVRYRDERGPFTMPEDLLQINGISPAVLDGLRPYIIF